MVVPDLAFPARISTSLRDKGQTNEKRTEARNERGFSRSTGSEYRHHLPRCDASAHGVQHDLLVVCPLSTRPEPRAATGPGHDVRDARPFKGDATVRYVELRTTRGVLPNQSEDEGHDCEEHEGAHGSKTADDTTAQLRAASAGIRGVAAGSRVNNVLRDALAERASAEGEAFRTEK